MSGDLGNLLTGEIGEAEVRFSHEDFAALYGRRIAGRVRRRRAVRAAGVGGGTMLTAGALVVGVTQVPWGTLGATPGAGESDCVTPSASSDSFTYTVTEAPLRTRLTIDYVYSTSGSVVLVDNGTGAEIVAGATQPDGAVTFTDADGNRLSAVLDNTGEYVVTLGSGTTLTIAAPDSQQGESVLRGVVMMQDGQWVVESMTSVDSGASPMSTPSDDCVTSGPTPSGDATASPDPIASADPSLAAKPEDVAESPFQCGFEFATDSYATATQSIGALEWVSPDEINAQIKASHPDSGSDIYQAAGQGAVPVVTVTDSFASSFDEWATGGGDAIDPMQMLGERDPDALPSGVKITHGSSFVAVTNGVVVGTIEDPFTPAATPPVYQRILGNDFDQSLALLNADSAFTACPGATLDGYWDVYAIAGDVARESNGTLHGPDYVWLKVGKP